MESVKPNAEVLYISKCRFCDPITAIGIGKTSVLHGSIMGRLVHYSIDKMLEKEIVGMSSEMVSAITLTADGLHYNIANGDIGWYVLPEDGLSPPRSHDIKISRTEIHHADYCKCSYTYQCGIYSCIAIVGPDDISLSNKQEMSV